MLKLEQFEPPGGSKTHMASVRPSDSFAFVITGRQLRAARVLQGWEQIELARRSRVAIGTIRGMESFPGEIGARTSTLSEVQTTVEKAGIEFLNDDRPGVRISGKMVSTKAAARRQ